MQIQLNGISNVINVENNKTLKYITLYNIFYMYPPHFRYWSKPNNVERKDIF